jgi:hypothetical protein
MFPIQLPGQPRAQRVQHRTACRRRRKNHRNHNGGAADPTHAAAQLLTPRGPALFCAVYLLVQLVLASRGPLSAGGQRVRFAWRMFLRPDRPHRYEIGLRDGRVAGLDQLQPRPLIEYVGSQVDRLRFEPPHLCRQAPDAAWVRIHIKNQEPVEYRCP